MTTAQKEMSYTQHQKRTRDSNIVSFSARSSSTRASLIRLIILLTYKEEKGAKVRK